MSLFKRTQSDQPSPPSATQDPTQAFKRRARQRLVGAVTLVATSVIVLPMILDAEPPSPLAEIVLTMPSKTPSRPSAQSSQLPPADDSPTPSAGGALTAPTEKTPSFAVPQPIPRVSPDKTASPLSASGQKNTSHTATDKSTEVSADTSQTASKFEKNGVKPTSEKTESEVSAPASPTGKSAPPSSTDRYWIQIGAFANPEKVSNLLNQLRQANFHPQTEELQTAHGKRTRVRLGPFSSKANAQAAQKRLQPLGLSGNLVVEK